MSDGLAGLPIRLGPVGSGVTFFSLGSEPALRLSLAHERRVASLSWTLALLCFLGGALALRGPRALRRAVIPAAILVTMAVPLLPGCGAAAPVLDRVFYAALWLIPYALLARPLARAAERLRQGRRDRAARFAAATLPTLLAATLAAAAPGAARAAGEDDRAAVRVDVPTNAVIVPYRADIPFDDHGGPDRMVLAPYDTYLRLLREERAGADDERPLPVAAAITAARVALRLTDGETVTARESFGVRVFARDGVSVPLTLKGAVLRSAIVNGRPAALAADGQERMLLHLAAAGEHSVELALDIPRIDAPEAIRHTGVVTVRRSPLIDVRVRDTHGLRRADLAAGGAAGGTDRLNAGSPLGTQPFAAFEFVSTPFGGTLEATLRRPVLEARTRSILRMAETETALETRVDLQVRERPLFRLRADIPLGYRVVLELQDDVMGEFKVLVEQDRALGTGRETARPPRIVTGRLDGAFIAIENAGRDEISVVDTEGMRPLDRAQKEWAAVDRLIDSAGSMAYAVQPGAEDARIVFETTRREAVQTAGARIGLALCTLALDASGAYRAEHSISRSC